MERQAQLNTVKQALHGNRGAVRRQMRRDRRKHKTGNADSGSSSSEDEPPVRQHQARRRKEHVEAAMQCVELVREMLKVDSIREVPVALGKVLGAVESLLGVRDFLDRVCRIVVPANPTDLSLLLGTLVLWKENYFQKQQGESEKEIARQQAETAERSFKQAFLEAFRFTDDADEMGEQKVDVDDDEGLYRRLGQLYSFVAQTTQFLSLLSNQVCFRG